MRLYYRPNGLMAAMLERARGRKIDRPDFTFKKANHGGGAAGPDRFPVTDRSRSSGRDRVAFRFAHKLSKFVIFCEH